MDAEVLADKFAGEAERGTRLEISFVDYERKIREALSEGAPVNWEIFWHLKQVRGYKERCHPIHDAYRKVVDLFLYFNILSFQLDGNIVLRLPNPASKQSIGNPWHYCSIDEEGYTPLFFTRDRDALEYIKTGESLFYLVKGYQAQRISVIR